MNRAKYWMLGYSGVEILVLEATNNDPELIAPCLLRSLAVQSFLEGSREKIINVLLHQMEMEQTRWRKVYKSLVVLEYLLKHGSEHMYDLTLPHHAFLSHYLDFEHLDTELKDRGVNVRRKVRGVLDLLDDVNVLRQERKQALEIQDRYVGSGCEVAS